MTERADLLDPGDERPKASTEAATILLAAAVFASLTVPDTPLGLGATLVAVVVATATIIARPSRFDGLTVTYSVLALSLAAMPTLRAAEWVVSFDLLAAMGLGALAVRRAVAWREVLETPLAVLRKIGAALPFTLEPFVPRKGIARRLGPVLRGGAIAAVLVLVFGALFVSADRAFAEIARDLLLPDIDLSLDLLLARILVFGFVLLGTGALILSGRRYALASGERVAAPDEPKRRLGRSEWILAIGLLDLLFAAFVTVQIAVFFGGRTHVLSTTGLTFAEYAREGFFQLVVVAALTFGVIAGAVRWARRDSPWEARVLQMLLGALCLLCLVVLASAFRRLTLYESVFGYTELRISVHAVILWMAGVFVLLLVAGLTMRARWLPPAVVVLTAAGLLAFSSINPDHLIASKNVDRYLSTGSIDLEYLASLSPDAVPALVRLPPRLARCALHRHAHLGPGAGEIDFTEKGHTIPGGGYGREAGRDARAFLAWNYGRVTAMQLIPAKQPAVDDVACLGAQRMGVWP